MNRKQRANFSISVLLISGLQFALSSSTTASAHGRPPVSTRPAKQLQNVKISSLSPEDVSLLSVESKKARATYLAGKLNDAVALQHKNVLRINGAADASAESDARALLSFLAWQQGNVLLALKEGEAAVKAAPGKENYLLNLALMKEALSDYDAAIDIYRRIRVDKNLQVQASLNIARCLFKLEKKEEGLAHLRDILMHDSRALESSLLVADLALQASQNQLAIESAQKILKVSPDDEKAKQARSLLLLAFLREGQADKAADYLPCLFDSSLNLDYESYVRSLELLVAALNPELGQKIVESALSRFSRDKEAEGLYRLGRICQNKAALVCFDKAKSGLWTEMSLTCYRQAVMQDPLQARYHLALSGIYQRVGESGPMFEEIKSAAGLDQFDALAAYYLRTLSSAKDNPVEEQATLERVSFKIDGLSCGCHLGKLESVFAKIDGVAFVSLSRQEPLTGLLMIEKKKTDAQAVLSECLKQFNAGPAQVQLKKPSEISFTVLEQGVLRGADEAIRVAQNARNGSVLEFYNQFKAQEPLLPVF